MGIRCIALDLDGTALDKSGRFSCATAAALRYALGRGVEVVVASGRSFVSLPEQVVRFPGLRYAVTSNGAVVGRLPSGECLRRRLMTESAVSAVVAIAAEPLARSEIACECFVDGVPHCSADYFGCPGRYGADARASRYIRATRRPEEDILSYIREHRREMESIDVVAPDESRRSALWREIASRAAGVYLTSSVGRLIEISDEGGGKHRAVGWLLDRLGIRPEETAAFGDGDNDAPLLAFVGAGVAVGNASPACRRAAAYVTAAHDDDGVAKWIMEYLPKL